MLVKNIFFILLVLTFTTTQVGHAKDYALQKADFATCEVAINNGIKISEGVIRNRKASYWVHDDRYFRLTISSLNLFSVELECEEIIIE